MSFQFGNSTGGVGNNNNRSYGGCPPQQMQMMGYSGNGNNTGYGYGSNGNNGSQSQTMPSMNMGYGGNGNPSYGAQSQMHYQQQQPMMQQNNMGGSPRMGVLPAGQQPDPNMKVIKLNWGDILGTGGQGGTHGLKVAMVGANGDVNSACNGLRCTFNGDVPQGMPVHVMNINPYANFLSGQGK